MRGTSNSSWRVAPFLVVASCLLSVFSISATARAAAPEQCRAERTGSAVSLSWTDTGGRYVIRRNGSWLTTVGRDVSSYVDVDSPAGASYVLRTRDGDGVYDTSCTGAAPPPPTGTSFCTAERSGTTVTARWVDDGSRYVVRRNDKWLATPGSNVDEFVDQQSPAGSTYELRIYRDGTQRSESCLELADPPPRAATERVIHVSLDGLRVDAITPTLMPNLTRLINEGASTLNARTDAGQTRTMPNHTSQLTGRPVAGPDGHGVDYNQDAARTVHQDAGQYVASVFDVVHDNGGRTAAFVTKSKLAMFDRSWNGSTGAPDTTGSDNGRDKIDIFERAAPEVSAARLAEELINSTNLQYAFLHLRNADSAGHASGWGSAAYRDAVSEADALLGVLRRAIDDDPRLRETTNLIVVADHGGPSGGVEHSDESVSENYTIPFVVWGPSVRAGSDLYELNSTSRVDPGTQQLPSDGLQPIRGHEVANLSLDLLGYPSVPGSQFNAAQDLTVR